MLLIKIVTVAVSSKFSLFRRFGFTVNGSFVPLEFNIEQCSKNLRSVFRPLTFPGTMGPRSCHVRHDLMQYRIVIVLWNIIRSSELIFMHIGITEPINQIDENFTHI